MTRRRLVLFVLVGVVGCGIDQNGQEDASPDVSVLDASPDVAPDAPPPPVCADAGTPPCYDAGLLRTPALFSVDAGATCPAGYQSMDLQGASNAPGGAFNPAPCTCVCTDGGPPQCDPSKASYQSSTGGGCGGDSGVLTLSADGGCTTLPFSTADDHAQFKTPAVIGGCGGGTSVAPPTQPFAARLCVPECTSDPSVCTGQTGLQACVYTTGNVGNCPPGYGSIFYVGQTPVVSCDQSCTCTETGNCTGAQFHYWSDTMCNSGEQHFNMDTSCQNNWGTFGSAKIENTNVGSPACTVSPAGNSKIDFGGTAFTVCCP